MFLSLNSFLAVEYGLALRHKICSGDYGSCMKLQSAKSKMCELLTVTLTTDAPDGGLS